MTTIQEQIDALNYERADAILYRGEMNRRGVYFEFVGDAIQFSVEDDAMPTEADEQFIWDNEAIYRDLQRQHQERIARWQAAREGVVDLDRERANRRDREEPA